VRADTRVSVLFQLLENDNDIRTDASVYRSVHHVLCVIDPLRRRPASSLLPKGAAGGVECGTLPPGLDPEQTKLTWRIFITKPSHFHPALLLHCKVQFLTGILRGFIYLSTEENA